MRSACFFWRLLSREGGEDRLCSGGLSLLPPFHYPWAVWYPWTAGSYPVCRAEVSDYLVERQDETWRNHVFSYGFYTLIEEGQTAAGAMQRLRGMREHEIHELVFGKGINLAKTPTWQRRGVMVYRKDGQVAAKLGTAAISFP